MEEATMSEKYPYLTAYVGLIALGALLNLILTFIFAFIVNRASAQIVNYIVTVVVSFFIFRFVIRKNVLPYVSQNGSKATLNE